MSTASDKRMDKKDFQELCKLLAKYDMHAIGFSPHFLGWEELYERVLITLSEEAEERGGSVLPVDGSTSLVMHGEFSLQDILREAITNSLTSSQRQRDKLQAAKLETGRDVCPRCYDRGWFWQWRKRVPPLPSGYDRAKAPCLLCNDTDTGE